MTLVVAVTGQEAIWLLADRRLSRDGCPPDDEGRKAMFLETSDGVAILGYAGLGATARRTEPAQWMSAVLRGQSLTLEHSLTVLAAAIEKQFPRHMIRMPEGAAAHFVIAPAFVGTDRRYYEIRLILAPDRKSYQFRCSRYARELPTGALITPAGGLGGTGGLYLSQNLSWRRDLHRVVRACDRGAVSPHFVADHLASINANVHAAIRDKSVGPRCVVAWRFRKGGGIQNGGGGHQFYTGLERDATSPSLPAISSGMDMSAIGDLFMTHALSAINDGKSLRHMDTDILISEMAKLPRTPDEKFR
jgi:hypothetical protein